MADKWFYSLKHVGRMERLPEELRVKVFERLFEACEIAKFSPQEKLKYEHDMMTERDYTNIINTSHANLCSPIHFFAASGMWMCF